MKQTSLDWVVENLPIRIKNAIENSCQEIIEEGKKGIVRKFLKLGTMETFSEGMVTFSRIMIRGKVT